MRRVRNLIAIFFTLPLSLDLSSVYCALLPAPCSLLHARCAVCPAPLRLGRSCCALGHIMGQQEAVRQPPHNAHELDGYDHAQVVQSPSMEM
mmetsp:Transcript_30209/g.60657  ORF Transcript_30209/g.60657 Transcript_30209/m.60657 type:complete len:92 (+) Transcript_30209:867-1142(+)